MQETAKDANAQALWHEDAVAYRDLLEEMLRLPKPIIAAVGGPAVAGGAGLVLASDIVLASPEAMFGLPEPKRGIVAGLVAPLLTFRLAAGRAAYLLMSAGLIAAEEAHRIGVYHELMAGEKLWPRAHQLAGEIASCAPEAMLLTKRMLNETIGEQLATLLTAGAAVSATARTTEAAAEGLAAFLERRAKVSVIRPPVRRAMRKPRQKCRGVWSQRRNSLRFGGGPGVARNRRIGVIGGLSKQPQSERHRADRGVNGHAARRHGQLMLCSERRR